MQNKANYIFEASWEVCNKVGGIYTVLSTKAKSMQELHPDKTIFIGPDVWTDTESPWFKEDESLFAEWKKYAADKENLHIRIGRWMIPGEPIVILVSFQQFFEQKNDIYAAMWKAYGVNSLHAYGDYDESCMFAYAAGKVIESFYYYNKLEKENVVAHFDEWMLGLGALYVKMYVPAIATVFTTHATTIGRSIAGNGKPLYNYMSAYDGDQMSRELNVEAKHSVEKIAANQVDCFTTVSEITARECKCLLGREPDVTPNGFEKDFIPTGKEYDKKRKKARTTLINVAEKLLGYEIDKDALLVATSGRYEYRNKGIDVFVDAMNRLRHVKQMQKDVIAFIMVPAWIEGPRKDLQDNIKAKKMERLPYPSVTHWLKNINHDSVMGQMEYLQMRNEPEDRVKLIFVPSYLNGDDGIFNLSYYDLLIGMDVTVFPSYYEPWGYTPHESIAFSVPTITTTLAGFGMWFRHKGDVVGMNDGGEVLKRDDYNFIELSEDICNRVFEMSTKSEEEEKLIRKAAQDKAALADWRHFYGYYEEVYSKALDMAKERNKQRK